MQNEIDTGASVAQQNCVAKEKNKKHTVVLLTNRIIDPGAVVIKACNMALGCGAVFGPCHLAKTCCMAYLVRKENNVIIPEK